MWRRMDGVRWAIRSVDEHQPGETATKWLGDLVRTKAAGSRAGSSTAKLLPIGQHEARNYDAPPWAGNLSLRPPEWPRASSCA